MTEETSQPPEDIHNLPYPGCMMPDGGPPCEGYKRLWDFALSLQEPKPPAPPDVRETSQSGGFDDGARAHAHIIREYTRREIARKAYEAGQQAKRVGEAVKEFEWLLQCAIRQYRHNDDNSPDVFNPEQGFAIGYDYERVNAAFEALKAKLEVE